VEVEVATAHALMLALRVEPEREWMAGREDGL